MQIKTVRLLNERPGWLGLSFWDMGGVGYFLLLSHALLKHFGLELLAFVLTGIALILLLKIRLKNRPKTIRDFLKSRMPIKKFNSKGQK